jgi:2-polyprenyl-3-methyl-5-hydroxy-6-metoxy-1,4-benzoquinol methylase
MADGYVDYGYRSAVPCHVHSRILPAILRFLQPALSKASSRRPRVRDVGCENGALCGELLARGCDVVGIDLSVSGIEIARRTHPSGRFENLAASEGLLASLGEPPFDAVVSTEVVEHLYAPRPYARGCFEAVRPGGRFVCTTPYHGYLKNLAISVCGKWDSHANPLWDGGHIKLWSRRSLSRLLTETGFRNLQFAGVGRVPGLWMSMAVAGDRPAG